MGIFDSLIIRFRGKNLGVVGPRAAGKTTFHSWIRHERLPREYRPTVAPQRQSKKRSRVDGQDGSEKVAFKEGLDVPGDVLSSLDSWTAVAKKADVLLFMFDASRALDPQDDHGHEMIQGCSVLSAVMADEGAPPRLALVGTHCDLIDGYAPPAADSRFVEFERRIRSERSIEYSLWSLGSALPSPPPLVLGSMCDEEAAAELASRVLRQHLGL